MDISKTGNGTASLRGRAGGWRRFARWSLWLLLLACSGQAFAQNCGAEGQNACPVWVRVPSCNALLVESGGRCVHPPCGREGEAACTVFQRVPSCDAGLVENNGRCGLPTPCGAQGQRACRIWERVPSCDPYLVESGGRCVHPACGREGEAACTINVRVPSCDINLAEVAGRCVLPTPCGNEGERACRVWERIPSCRHANLIESGGRCIHPACGREGEAACTVNIRVPSCDAGLIETNGRCSLPTPCGQEGQRACRVWEHVPSCRNRNLIESGGRCVHPSCGREGEAACTLNVRIPSCDEGLVENNGRCGLPTPCGQEGQRACRVWEHIPSCRSRNLVESGGSCVHPSCGREGEAACTVNLRVPSCDEGLVENNGRCGLPTPCGNEGQRACRVWEHIPSCRSRNLVESGGSCVHPACGRTGEAACTVNLRVPSCDEGLIEVNGRCGPPTPCGGEGERACFVWERLPPSCNAGLLETGGRCVHPPCGREGERACLLTERVPSCDGALVETGGRCVRPSPGCGGPDQPACTLTQRLTPCDAGLAQVRGLCIVKTPCGGRGQRACALDERREQAGTLRGRACAVRLREIPGCTGECFGSSGTCGDPLARMTEPSIDMRLLPRTAPMRGYADVHVHMFSHLAFGGGVLAGRPYDPQAGAAAALRPDYATDLDLVSFAGTDLPTVNCPPTIPGCGRVVLHGDHVPVIDDSAGMGTGDGTTSNFGAPLFNGWPTWHTTSHQQVYYRWLERAWRGGLRLMVMLAVNNEVLCKTSKRVRGTDCDRSMPAIDAQLQAAKDFERWINAQRGGGWFVIVRTPDEAERAIRAGKLAVVLGIETDSLFDCKAFRPCSPQYIAEQVAKYRDLGVRHIYPVHNFDNGLVGTAVWMNILNAGNRVIERQWYDVGACTTSDFRPSTDFASFAVGPIFNLIEDNNNVPYPAYPRRPGCNVRGLAPGGVDLVGQLMNAGMMIDIDHMSHRSVDETIALARSRGGYPLVAGHGLFSEVYEAAGTRHERMRTREQLDALRDLGGLVSVMTVDEMDRGGEVARPGGGTYVNDCLHSSKSFAQNYLYAIGVMRGPVALGSDFNGFAPHVGPRFGDDGCGGDAAQWAAQRRAGGRLAYPFTLTGFGVFDRQRSGQRTFDFNVDGLAHIGLLPDLIADMQTTGVSEEELDPLFRSAQAYVEAWRKAERLRTPPSP